MRAVAECDNSRHEGDKGYSREERGFSSPFLYFMRIMLCSRERVFFDYFSSSQRLESVSSQFVRTLM